MFKNVFTKEQLTSLFQIAIFLTIIAFFLDLIVYHFFPNNYILDVIATNLNNTGIIIIYTIIISQAIIIFIDNHQNLVAKYNLLAIAIEIFIAAFFFWILHTDNDIEGKFIMFSSSLSIFDHSYKVMLLLVVIFIMLLIDFYKNITSPMNIDNESVSETIRDAFVKVAKRHLLLLIFIFGIAHFKKIHKFSIALIHHNRLSLFYDLRLLEILIPGAWICFIIYYFYQKFQSKKINL
jgi:hypothetical protein